MYSRWLITNNIPPYQSNLDEFIEQLYKNFGFNEFLKKKNNIVIFNMMLTIWNLLSNYLLMLKVYR